MQHARELVNQLKAEIFTEMDEGQLNTALRIAKDSCSQHFSSDINMATMAAADNDSQDNTQITEDQSDDWFTERILKGKTPDKDGNKRLKRLRHK